MGRLYRTKSFWEKGCVWQLPQFLLSGKEVRWNRISHPDWVKLYVELNYAPNQNTKIPSATGLIHRKTKQPTNQPPCHYCRELTSNLLFSHRLMQGFFVGLVAKKIYRIIAMKTFLFKNTFFNLYSWWEGENADDTRCCKGESL